MSPLLALRLTRAPEDLVYDSKREIFRPRRADDKGEPEVTKAQLYYQSEAGGRKAGGVFYTRHEFVEHLLNHALLPALDDHLEEIKRIAADNPKEAARRLFDFSVVDPAMGSAHFLTAALDMMADRIETFLSEVGGLPGIAQQLSELTHDNTPSTNPPDARGPAEALDPEALHLRRGHLAHGGRGGQRHSLAGLLRAGAGLVLLGQQPQVRRRPDRRG